MGALAVTALVAGVAVLITGDDLFERFIVPLFLASTVVICADRMARTIQAAQNGIGERRRNLPHDGDAAPWTAALGSIELLRGFLSSPLRRLPMGSVGAGS